MRQGRRILLRLSIALLAAIGVFTLVIAAIAWDILHHNRPGHTRIAAAFIGAVREAAAATQPGGTTPVMFRQRRPASPRVLLCVLHEYEEVAFAIRAETGRSVTSNLRETSMSAVVLVTADRAHAIYPHDILPHSGLELDDRRRAALANAPSCSPLGRVELAVSRGLGGRGAARFRLVLSDPTGS